MFFCKVSESLLTFQFAEKQTRGGNCLLVPRTCYTAVNHSSIEPGVAHSDCWSCRCTGKTAEIPWEHVLFMSALCMRWWFTKRRYIKCTHLYLTFTWLSVHQRVQFKLAVLLLKALHGQAPQCLTDDCQLVAAAGRRQLRSSDAVTFLVPRTRTCLSDRAFGVAGPRLWNALPISLRQPHLSLGHFRRAL